MKIRMGNVLVNMVFQMAAFLVGVHVGEARAREANVIITDATATIVNKTCEISKLEVPADGSLVVLELDCTTKAAKLLPPPAFADGFEDAAGVDPPPVALCTPVAPDYPPTNMTWNGTMPLTSLPRTPPDMLYQVRQMGGRWNAYSFTRESFPSDLMLFAADTSNVGPSAVGAELVTFNFSECEGDFRKLVPGCFGTVGEGYAGSLNFSGDASQGGCPVVPGKTYYWNVHMGAPPCNSYYTMSPCAFRFDAKPM